MITSVANTVLQRQNVQLCCTPTDGRHRGRRPVCRNRVVGMGNLTQSPAERECRCVTGLAIIRTLPLTQAILSLLRSFFELYRLESESPVFRV